MIAEPPAYRARALTHYTEDDGRELSGLCWTHEGTRLIWVRGGEGRSGIANPAFVPSGTTQEIWSVPLAGGAPVLLGEGHAPAASPRGSLLAYLRRGQLWVVPLDGSTPGSRAFEERGTVSEFVWSPGGERIAFVAARDDHSFIGIWDTAANTLRYLDPSTSFDRSPSWSPDGASVAFLRIPGTGLRAVRQALRSGEPWSIRVADVARGTGRVLFRAAEGAGSVYHSLASPRQLLWTATGRIVFPWERDGWSHLYSIPLAGGTPALLTPGTFEVEYAALSSSGTSVIYSSNQNDADRSHLWDVAATGGLPRALSSGDGIEGFPTPIAGGDAIALIRSDALHPPRAALLLNGTLRDLDPESIPAGFPSSALAVPQAVEFTTGDGVRLHAQWLPPRGTTGRAPAVVFFHGGSRRQMLLGWHNMEYYTHAYALNEYLAASGVGVLSVNYRSGTGYGMEFREATGYGPSGASEYKDVEAAAAWLTANPSVDAERIGVWGGSYGGYLTAMALAKASEVFKVGVDFHGVHDWATELAIPATEADYGLAFASSPLAQMDGWRSPVLLIAGDDDPDVQFNQTVRLAAALRQRKVEYEELILPGEGHTFWRHSSWLTAYNEAAEFLLRHLGVTK
jgi:dipeptidyl aminopeptidase/acylaminoacyl peptidase